MGLGLLFYNILNKRLSIRCKRCGLRYTIDYQECPRCSEITDKEVVQLKRVIRRDRRASKKIGKVLLIAAAVLIIVLLLVIM